MSEPETLPVSLATIADSEAADHFDAELDRVLRNIADPNTDAGAKRTVVLKVEIEPDQTRREGKVRITARSTIAPFVAAQSTIFMGTKNGREVAIARNPKHQPELFDKPLGPRATSAPTGTAD